MINDIPTMNQAEVRPFETVKAESLSALQAVVSRNLIELARIKKELKIERQSLKNVFDNDSALSQSQKEVDALSNDLKEHKARLLGTPETIQYKTKIAELNEQKKEIEEAVSNHLLNLFQITGTKTFDTPDGKQVEFSVKTAIKPKQLQLFEQKEA